MSSSRTLPRTNAASSLLISIDSIWGELRLRLRRRAGDWSIGLALRPRPRSRFGESFPRGERLRLGEGLQAERGLRKARELDGHIWDGGQGNAPVSRARKAREARSAGLQTRLEHATRLRTPAA